ncbi:formylglycine-generating enzyme family protein [bacterium]|nr:formylglycine-generating enzyme family protein [bacterium]
MFGAIGVAFVLAAGSWFVHAMRASWSPEDFDLPEGEVTPPPPLPNDPRCPEGMVWVPGGPMPYVTYGERWGGGRHTTTVSVDPFCVDAFEASQPGASDMTMGDYDPNKDDVPPAQSVVGVRPWINVSYETARAACEKAGKRLPAPAEWQMAFSGASGDDWPWGDKVKPNDCHAGKPYGTYPTGGCGFVVCNGDGACSSGPIYDMVGGVSEIVDGKWDAECYPDEILVMGGAAHYAFIDLPVQTEDPEKPGCWRWASYGLSRPAMHHHSFKDDWVYDDDGFRCAKDPEFTAKTQSTREDAKGK